MKKITLLLFFTLGFVNFSSANIFDPIIIYVSSTASGTGDGSSWDNAFTTVQSAISTAQGGDSIFVKKGIYLLSSTVALKDGVKLYGSFNGTETSLSERNFVMEQEDMTILDGQNQRRVMHANNNGVTSSTEVDGFVFQKGRVTGSNFGGGIYLKNTSPIIKNCIIYNNYSSLYGGGIAIFDNSAEITNCIIINNNSSNLGGGLYLSNSNSKITNCLFRGNSAIGGGGINTADSSPEIVNCTFVGNKATTAQYGGGGIRCWGTSNAKIKNSIIFGNTGVNGANIYNIYGGTHTRSYSLLEGSSYAANENIVAPEITIDALFYLTTENDYRLKPVTSNPAINSGNNTLIPEGITKDLAGQDRVSFANVDLGAYEVDYFPVTYYVDNEQNGDGSTWQNAFQKLEDALSIAQNRDSIFVAQGTYQHATFHYSLKEGVKMYGGYPHGGGTRNIQTHETILQANVGWRVFYNSNNGLTPLTILDGFTISGGDSGNSNGGGMYNNNVSPTIVNCKFTGNTTKYFGGGMYNDNSSPVISNCAFIGNSATTSNGYGGAMYNSNGSSPLITHSIFKGNTANLIGGGIMNVSNSNPTITNSLFTENHSNVAGSMYNSGSSPIITNCTFAKNSANSAVSTIFNTSSTPVITNTIVYSNSGGIHNTNATPVITYSLIQGNATIENGNIDGTIGYPNLFSDFVNNDFTLGTGSPAIDAGNNSSFSSTILTDLSGNQRIINSLIDMGAYESPYIPKRFYVNDDQNGDGSSWANAFGDLQDAIAIAQDQDEIWVAAGMYKPGTAQNSNFNPAQGVTLLGGFNATETEASQRNATLNPTILSGDLNNSNSANPGDSSKIVFIAKNDITFDGFIFEYAYEDNGRYGGAVLNNATNISINNCVFRNNTVKGTVSDGIGAGYISNAVGSSATLTNCLFHDNNAFDFGGAVVARYGDVALINCTLVNNSADHHGAGLYSIQGNITAINTIISNNNSPNNGNASQEATGSINLNYCLVFDGGISEGIIITNEITINGLDNTAIFVDFENDDYHLVPSVLNPAVNSGNNESFPEGITTDLEGNERIKYETVDLGAYEINHLSQKIYVDDDQNGDGTSWETAFQKLEDAINAAQELDVIYVAKGNYNAPAGSFIMKENVKIYGSFEGTENTLEERILVLDESEMSVLNGQNTKRVISNNLNALTHLSVLDGFVIKNGSFASGAGMYNNQTSPSITNCIFTNNTATGTVDGGGAIFNNHSSSPLIKNCIFKNNSTSNYGGAIQNTDHSNAKMINCLFYENAALWGAVSYNESNSISETINCTLTNNSDTYDAIIANINAGVIIKNSLIFGNTASLINNISSTQDISYSFVQGLTDTNNGNISSDGFLTSDVFMDFENGNYLIKSNSPVVNLGNNAVYTNAGGNIENDSDIAGNPRIFSNTIDIGALEVQEISITPNANNILFVNIDSPNTNGNGDSWDNAIIELADALKWAKENQTNWNSTPLQIWVAGGTYKPKYSPEDGANFGTNQGKENSFLMVKNVQLYGNFAGTETNLTDRNINNAANASILSGDVDGDDEEFTNVSDNNNHVIISSGAVGSARLDGFTVSGGGGFNGYVPFSTIAVNSNTVEDISGGGMVNYESSPTIVNSSFSNNYGNIDGGGIYNYESSPTIVNCFFSKNKANNFGGGICNENDSSPTIRNCFFIENSADDGNGMYNIFISSATIINCTFIGNTTGSEIYNAYNSILKLFNTIVWGSISNIYYSSTTNKYSLVKGNLNTANGNINATGLTLESIFVNPANNDYTININSPALNAGNNSLYTSSGGNLNTNLDLSKNPRLAIGTIDIGAFEFKSACLSLTSWDGTAWSNGLPDLDTFAKIDGDLVVNENLEACELQVNEDGSLTIAEGNALLVNGKINNAASDTDFVVSNGANLIQNEEVENSGAIMVRRNSFPLYRQDYTLWASPVQNQNLRNFSPQTLFNRFSTYDTGAGTTVGEYVQEIFTLADVQNKIFETAKGYLIRMPNNWTQFVSEEISGTPFPGEFTGVPNNGTISIPLALENEAFNLVGNPYPSAVSIDAFFNDNPNIAQTIYFWRKRNGVAGSGYATYTTLGLTSPQPELNGLDMENTIEVGQGFFIKSTGATTLNFNNQMRSATQNGTFLRSENINQKHRIWLNLSNAENVIGQTLLGYCTNATNGVDNGLDGAYFNDSSTALTSLINNNEYTIQARTLPFDSNDVVPLGFKTDVAGNYSISIFQIDGVFDENQDVFLKDKYTNQLQDLKLAAYTFTTNQGIFNDRFEIVYQSTLSTNNQEMNSNTVFAYKQDEAVVINSGNVEMQKVEVIDMQGRLIYSLNEINTTNLKLQHLNVKNQVIIIKITTVGKEVVTRKIML